MKHKKTIEYRGGLEQLVIDIGDLQYDSLQNFLTLLAQKIQDDSEKDFERGRTRLSQSLSDASKALVVSGTHIEKAWKICEPYMK